MLVDKIQKSIWNQVDPIGLSLYRMAFAVILFLDVRQIHAFRDVVYDIVPGSLNSGFDIHIIYPVWKIILACIFFGCFTRIANIANYVLIVAILGSLGRYEYHVYYTYTTLAFLHLFIPLNRSLSVDSFFRKFAESSIETPIPKTSKVFAAYYMLPLFVALAFVYSDSVLFKLCSPMWMKGLGMWLPSNLSLATWNNHVTLANSKLLMISIGYLVIFFESIFILFMWFKNFRLPLVVIGLGLHFGILVEFPIPWFALSAVGLYILMIPIGFWLKLNLLLKSKNPLVFRFNPNISYARFWANIINSFDLFGRVSLLPDNSTNLFSLTPKDENFTGEKSLQRALNRTIILSPISWIVRVELVSKAIIRLIDVIDNSILKKHAIYSSNDKLDVLLQKSILKALALFFIYLQIQVSLTSLLPENMYKKLGLWDSEFKAKIYSWSTWHHQIGIYYFGITHHPVFMDIHFDGYNHIFRIAHVDKLTGKESFLPIIDELGMPDYYIRGAFWVNYTFRTSARNFNWDTYTHSISRYARHWLGKKYLDPMQTQHFKIYCSKVRKPSEWEYDFLRSQINSLNWVHAGDLELEGYNMRFKAQIEDIEKY